MWCKMYDSGSIKTFKCRFVLFTDIDIEKEAGPVDAETREEQPPMSAGNFSNTC